MTRVEGSSSRPPAAGEGGGSAPAGRSASGEALVLRRMRPADLSAVWDLERRSFAVPWGEETFGRLLRAQDARAWTAVDDSGDVVGYAVSWLRSRGAQLGNLAVAAGHRRRGLGRRLVRTAMEAARDDGAEHLVLEVRESNRAALGLYRSMGFRLLGRKKGYYRSPPEDALVMAIDTR